MKILNLLVFCLGISACTNRQKVPAGIIQPDSMQAIMNDVVLVDQFATNFLLKDSLIRDSTARNVKMETLQLYEAAFKLHGVTKDEFRKSLAFYESRPDLLKNIFDSLAVDEARHRTDIYKARSVVTPAAKDSSPAHGKDSLKLHTGNPKK